MLIFKSLFLNNLRSKTLGQIQNRDPHRLMSRLRPLQATLLELGHTPIDAWIQKMDIDSDGGRREFGLRGQRRGTGSDKGTAANFALRISRSRSEKDSGLSAALVMK